MNVFCPNKGAGKRNSWINNVDQWHPGRGFVLSNGHQVFPCKPFLTDYSMKAGGRGSPMAIRKDLKTGDLIGVEVDILNMVCNGLRINRTITMDVRPGGHGPDGSWLGVDAMLLKNQIDLRLESISLGTDPLAIQDFDFTSYLYNLEVRFGARIPIQLVILDNLTPGFDTEVWIGIGVTLIIFAMLFAIVFNVYKSTKYEPIIGYYVSKFDFLLLTFSAFSEPDGVPWFKGHSSGEYINRCMQCKRSQRITMVSGRFLVLLWGLFSTFQIHFFQCNLRYHLIAPAYEKRIDSERDVLERNKPVWVPMQLVKFRSVFKSRMS